MLWRFVFMIGLLCLVSVSVPGEGTLDDLNLPPVEKKPWRFDGFPILAWWPPPGTATLADFLAYKEAGFTLYPANPDIGFDNALKFAAQAGLKIMPYRDKQGFALPDKEVVFPKDNEHIVGWITNDEPSGIEAVTASITAVNKLMRQDPTRWTLFNFLPPHVQHNPSTKPIIDAAVRNGMPILSYDNYVIMADGTDKTLEHFNNLELFRKASLEHDIPFWAFALTIKHFSYRRASESDLRWKHFTNLAYGAKGLWYFTYWGPTDWERWDTIAIVDPKNGDKTEIYNYVKTLNHAVLEMGDILLDLTNEMVTHTNPPEGHAVFEPDKFWIANIKAKDALVSFFKDSKGEEYAMVVNKLHGMNKTAKETADLIELTFAPDVKGVESVNWLDGKKGTLALENNKASLNIYGGTGVLLKRMNK